MWIQEGVLQLQVHTRISVIEVRKAREGTDLISDVVGKESSLRSMELAPEVLLRTLPAREQRLGWEMQAFVWLPNGAIFPQLPATTLYHLPFPSLNQITNFLPQALIRII